MKLINERRKGNFIMVFVMAIVFLLSFIYILKYYDLQARYYDLLRKQAMRRPLSRMDIRMYKARSMGGE